MYTTPIPMTPATGLDITTNTNEAYNLVTQGGGEGGRGGGGGGGRGGEGGGGGGGGGGAESGQSSCWGSQSRR